ncbi:MAG: CD1247 N-terminal domain-containing protein [Vulcanibacillus sp.]
MDIVQQKIAHLKGLAEGMEMLESKDGKVYSELIDIISNLDENVQQIQTRLIDLEDYVDVIDEDLNEMENEFYDDDTEDDFDNLLAEDNEDINVDIMIEE